MPKRKKTRREKVISDLRRKTDPSSSQETNSLSYSLPEKQKTTEAFPEISSTKKSANPNAAAIAGSMESGPINVIEYRSVSTELKKIILLTGSIVALELLIFFFAKGI